MVPETYLFLDKLPLTANGKMDKKALPDPDESVLNKAEFVAPRSELETQMCEVWQDVLSIEQVGIEDDFFELGGHSLLAVRLVSRVREFFLVELPVKVLFEHSTISGLMDELAFYKGKDVLPSIELVDRAKKHPLSFAQQR